MGIEEQQLWQSTLGVKGDLDKIARNRLRTSFLSFRERVATLIHDISSTLPGLTVHDITHLDALWRVAREVAGGDYPINPAEAYVLGGGFLLHDAAHAVAAFPNGLKELKESLTWRDLVAQRYGGAEPPNGSPEERAALFQVLRQLHATQAQELPKLSWKDAAGDSAYLIEDSELRAYYGDVIGEVAASHHWPTHKVTEAFSDRYLAAPAFLQPAAWQVDLLKVALLLRTADAAHVDALRAPWFLFALKQPEGISKDHWKFQSKLGQPTRNSDGYLILTSGSSFSSAERTAWWLAFDTAQMIDRELRDAYVALRDTGRKVFAAIGVLGSNAPESFSRQVRTKEWEPFNIGPRVGDVPKLISALGGRALYGDDPVVPIRELLQNSMDAVRALRALGGIAVGEGEVEISVDYESEDHSWIRISDTGVGMSRHVLTNVLLDFGASLWTSDILRDELPGLASKGFRAVGGFGIGFYSAFMIADRVEVITRRFERKAGDSSDQWKLVFDDGLSGRPLVTKPLGEERLKRHGTVISLRLGNEVLRRVLQMRKYYFKELELSELVSQRLPQIAGYLAPSSDVRIYSRTGNERSLVVSPNDWVNLSDEDLTGRVDGESAKLYPLIDGGRIVGRLGLSSRHFGGGAAVVINGLRCGEANGLSGLVMAASNNFDAKRTQISVGGSLESWRSWAENVIDAGSHSSADLERLHPLQPGLDLPVWSNSGEPNTMEELSVWIGQVDEIIVHEGQITHEDYDEMGRDYFVEFEYEEGIICIPSPMQIENAFPWFLGVAAIDYSHALAEALTQRWGEFEYEEEEGVLVGYVRGVEILRPVKRYRRVGE